MNHSPTLSALGGLGIALLVSLAGAANDPDALANARAGSPAGDPAGNPGMFRYPDVSASEIVFVYANDLWVVSRDGGVARPIASPPGQETFPRFSPGGRSVAFVGNYDGDRDLYTVATAGGIPVRVTHHPGNERLNDWTNTGELLFSFNALSGNPAQQQLFTVPPGGGTPEALPIPYGAVGTISDDGQWLAYTPDSRDYRTWKRYRGGLATDIWLYNLTNNNARRITDWEGTDTAPMWHGKSVYYLSDQGEGSRLNIWRYDTQTDAREQITRYTDFDVKFPAIGPGPNGRGEIVFQHRSHLHLLDLSTQRSAPVDIRVPGALETLRPRAVNAKDNLSGGGISATGKRAVVEARGDIFTIPAENGPVRQITNTSGAAERSPAWSPDGRWIAYFSDEGGEYELYITQSDGRGETRQITDGHQTFWFSIAWSPDSKTVLLRDKAARLVLVDIESGESTEIDRDPAADRGAASWSHDSRWIAYARTEDRGINSVIWLYDTSTNEKHKVTSGFFNDDSPAFSSKGDHLFYHSNRNFASPDYEDIGSSFVYTNTGRLIAVPLNDTVKNPRLLKSDEETWEDAEEAEDADRPDGSDESDESTGDNSDDKTDDDTNDKSDAPEHLKNYDTEHPLFGQWEGTAKGFSALGMPQDEISFSLIILVDTDGNITGRAVTMGEEDDLGDVVKWDAATGEFSMESTNNGATITQKGTVSGDTMTGTWELKQLSATGSWTANRTTTDITAEDVEKIEGESTKAAETVEIDLEGFESRGFELDVPAGNFSSLASNDGGDLLYLRRGDQGSSLKLYDPTEEKPSEKTVLALAMGFSVSADGKKLVAATPGGLAIVDAKPGQTAKPLDADLRKTVDLRAEWRGIVTDAWRRQRDFFYVENMHGVDWDATLAHYLPMVDDAVSREDVSYIIGEMIGELNVGHAYYSGGDTENEPSTNVGMLGVDFAVATAEDGSDRSGFRIETIHHGAAWDSDARNPLQAHGLDVKQGDIITHVNGAAADTAKDPWAAFIGTAGKPTNITVVSALTGDDETINERTVTVEPMSSETNLRFRAWIESNRRYVEEASDGRIGYIYVPNTGVQGQNELFRQFFGQIGKDALLIDERWNGGGQIPTRFIELLNRPRTNYWYRRDGRDWPWPFDSHQGPKAMLINGNAGSGGDMFPWLFRKNGLGKLIGTRTWGGLVGITGMPPLVDGGRVTVPDFGFYETDGTWGVEGHGVDPDIEIIADPSKMTDGRDPQLDAGIQHLLAEIESNGYRPPQRPAPPVRTGIGIEDADR